MNCCVSTADLGQTDDLPPNGRLPTKRRLPTKPRTGLKHLASTRVPVTVLMTLRGWFQKHKTHYVRPDNRRHARPRVEMLEDRVNPSSLALLTTDQPDYAPGSTALFSGAGFEVG